MQRHKTKVVTHENLLASFYRLCKRWVGASELFTVSFEGIVVCENNGLALDKGNFVDSIFKEARANLGSFGIQQDGYE